MKSLVKIMAPVIVVLAAATAVAVAAPIPPTAPYPDVPANADVCKVEKLEIQKQQAKYDLAKGNYDRTLALYQRGSASIEEVENAEAAVHNAEIALSNAKYAEAACRNKLGNDPKKACIDLSLELNRLIDELAIRKELERLARNAYDRALNLARTGAISAEQLAAAKTAWQVAVIERQQVEQKITDQRAAIAANPACRDYPSERPTPTSTTPTTPTSPTTTPTSPSPTTPTSPDPTTPSSPSPTSTMPVS
jgi:tetratricopeptide (TPR) repeat protein